MSNQVTRKRRSKSEIAISRLPRPISPLSDAALAYWPTILGERASDDWNPVDLQVAGKLAESIVLHARASNTLASQELTFTTESGQIKPNPLVGIVTQLATDTRSWYRTLGLKNPIRPSRLAARASAETEVVDDSDDFPVFKKDNRAYE
jgi:phage terminase small subunit